VLRVGKRLVTKLFNAGKFVLSQPAEVHPVTAELDRAFVERLRRLVASVTAAQEEFEFARALAETESFFWHDFTDTFLELVKVRARDGDAAGRGSAVAALRLGLSVLLRLFAPVLPYITEEVWSWAFADETGQRSIHRAPWPDAAELATVPAPAHPESFDAAVACFTAINKGKSEGGASVGRGVRRLAVATSRATESQLAPVAADVMAAARVEHWNVRVDPALDDGAVALVELELAAAMEA
jgi:valyl-tRNA synthetase